ALDDLTDLVGGEVGLRAPHHRRDAGDVGGGHGGAGELRVVGQVDPGLDRGAHVGEQVLAIGAADREHRDVEVGVIAQGEVPGRVLRRRIRVVDDDHLGALAADVLRLLAEGDLTATDERHEPATGRRLAAALVGVGQAAVDHGPLVLTGAAAADDVVVRLARIAVEARVIAGAADGGGEHVLPGGRDADVATGLREGAVL